MIRGIAGVAGIHVRATDHRIQKGFTLLELMVVVVIIGLLAALVVPRYFNTVSKSKATIARAQMDSLEKALEEYRLDVGSLPTREQGLQVLLVAPAGGARWRGPYLKKDVPSDPWGNPYLYRPGDGGHDIEIISLGSDGQPGGAGDAKDIYLSGTD
ncbi:type II secretion system major pseudopilin GspG [Ramlibacter sp. G-1-2-2]|uniref:Type II secretion system core protein G n=1 Tax=Ramlibacter agri TaxID=2728837 RepID=A0A848GYT7_9BURK|nr:type II secretion system major pseudopilin GspG [Ramlibacter agri]NML43484.1 type II secretion system major pseudopilin GspG [Ramlibacter agri]